MKILAFDTSTEYLSIALSSDGSTLTRECLAVQQHAALLLPMVREVMAEASLSFTQLDCIAFGAGPGSFTGLRIACSVAQGLAFGAGIPVVGVSTLRAMAHASGGMRVIAALDARMGEIYHAAYEKINGEWKEVIAPNVCKTISAPALKGNGWIGVGNGFAVDEILQARFGSQIAQVDASCFPHAISILELAQIEFAAGRAVAAELAAPIYIRNKVAMTHAEQTQQKAKA